MTADAAAEMGGFVANSQEDPATPFWLQVLTAIADSYVNAQAEAEVAAAGSALMQIADGDALRHASAATRLIARDRIARACFTRYMSTNEEAALDSAIMVGLDAADDISTQFGAGSPITAVALTQVGHHLASRAVDRGNPRDIEQAIALLHKAQETGALPADYQIELFTSLGNALWARYSHSHDVQDLEQSIHIWEAARDEIPDDSPEWPGCLRNIGVMLAERFAITGERADIDRALDLLELAVGATSSGSSWLASRREALLKVLRTHFDTTNQPADLDRTAHLLETLAQDSDPPIRRRYLSQLARVLDDKITFFGGERSTLERCVDILEGLLAETPADDPQRPDYQAQLAMALHQLAEHTDGLDLTNRAAGLALQALEATAAASSARAAITRDLAAILRGRAKKTGSREDVDEAIRLLEQLDRPVRGTPGAYARLVSLGNALLLRYQLDGKAGDLDRAVRIMEEAVTYTLPQSPERLVALRNVTAALHIHHMATANTAVLERLTSVLQERHQAGDSAIDDWDAERLVGEYDATSDIGTLDAAISALKATMATATSGSEVSQLTLIHLGVALWKKYEHTGDLDLLNQAIRIYEDLLTGFLAESSLRPSALANLGLCLRDRYVRTANAADLNRAITTYREALASPSVPEPVRYEVYGNLGLALWDRYGATGNLHDLDNAITAIHARVALPVAHGRNDGNALTTLGLALRDRYVHSHDPEDLARAVRAHEEAFALTSPASPRHGTRLNNLGGTHYVRWLQDHDPADLDRAIQAFEQSSVMGAPGQVNRLRALANLAVALRHRYKRTRALADLDRAIGAAESAIAESPADLAELPQFLRALADALRTRYDQMGRRDDLQRAIRTYRDCCTQAQHAKADLDLALHIADRWCTWASGRGAWQEAAEAAELAVAAMIQLYHNQYGRADKEAWLASSRGIPALAAYAIAMTGNPGRAALMLESSRTLLLSEALQQDRADLNTLTMLGHGDLVNRYREATEHWTRLLAVAGQPLAEAARSMLSGLADASPETERFLTSWQHGEQLKAARAALDATIASVREIPGHEHFLQAPGIEDIQTAADSAPLIYLIAADHGGMALIVGGSAEHERERQVKLVQLPGLTAAETGRWVTALRTAHDRREDQLSWRGALDAITAHLWRAAIGPVTAALEGAASATLIPVGQLLMLPFHAAWTTDTSAPLGRRYAMDEITLSYAPNAVSLRAAVTAASRTASHKLLVIEEPRPTTRRPLPFAEAEAAAVAAQFAQHEHAAT